MQTRHIHDVLTGNTERGRARVKAREERKKEREIQRAHKLTNKARRVLAGIAAQSGYGAHHDADNGDVGDDSENGDSDASEAEDPASGK